MKNRVVDVPALKKPLMPCPGFEKKELADYKLDICALCGFGCRYCSSNSGNYLRMRREEFANLTEHQLGERLYPASSPELAFHQPDVLARLEAQLREHKSKRGAGKTLMFGMLTDGYSPRLVKNGTTERALCLVLDYTDFRIRGLTKNAIVGSKYWIRFFKAHPGRFVVGLSVGTLDGRWARRIEVGTSSPTARLRALRRLQEAGIPTFGMLCPVFPDVLHGRRLEDLIEQIDPSVVETIWAEPYNDRNNWRVVRDGYPADTAGYETLTRTFEGSGTTGWSDYATRLYARLRSHAEANDWLPKLRFLLYEHDVAAAHVKRLRGLEGVLLQSKPAADGLSANPAIAELQANLR